MKKVFFRCISSCFTHLLVFFTGKTNMQKFEMGTSTGRLLDLVAGRPGDQMMGRWSYMFFKFNSETYLTYFDRLLETL